MTEDDTPVDDMLSEKQQRLLTEALSSSWVGPGEGRTFLASSNVGVFAQLDEPPVVWQFGKFPDLVAEVVSNREGGEEREKKRRSERMRIPSYVVSDPFRRLSDEPLKIYRFDVSGYRRQREARFPELGLGLTVWDGTYEDSAATWLRWTDSEGNLIPTGRERADRLAERLRQAGIDPDAP